MAQPAVGRPFGELDLADQIRPSPVRAAATVGRDLVEGHGRKRAVVQQPAYVQGDFIVEAGADLAGIDQLFLGIIAQQERSDPSPAAFRLGKAADDEFLALVALDLQPVAIAPGTVARIAALADHALIGQAADVFQHVGLVGEMLAIEHATAGIALLQQGLQPPLAFQQGQVAQVLAIERQQVEDVILQTIAAAMAQLVLQGLEAGGALVVERDDLAVEHGRLDAQLGQVVGQGLELRRPV